MSHHCPHCKSKNISVLIAEYMCVFNYICTSALKASERVLCRQCDWLGTVGSLKTTIVS